MEVIDFEVRELAIEGLMVLTAKQVSDERGTIREIFRRSAFGAAGIDLAPFEQINATSSARGAVRGMHAEAMTKLVTLSAGEALGAFVDLRPGSTRFGAAETVELRPGVEVLVPAGVANGFQALTDGCVYVYCFDAEWRAGMPGLACSPIDPRLDIDWPLPIDPDDPAQISVKDRDAPTLAALRVELGTAQ